MVSFLLNACRMNLQIVCCVVYIHVDKDVLFRIITPTDFSPNYTIWEEFNAYLSFGDESSFEDFVIRDLELFHMLLPLLWRQDVWV